MKNSDGDLLVFAICEDFPYGFIGHTSVILLFHGPSKVVRCLHLTVGVRSIERVNAIFTNKCLVYRLILTT